MATRHTTLRLTEADVEVLTRLSRMLGTTISAAIRVAARESLALRESAGFRADPSAPPSRRGGK